jgi:hypothetical protein
LRRVSRIARWHWGKVAILWAWGAIVVVALWRVFLSLTPSRQPTLTTAVFGIALATLLVLSIVTWLWLGGKESRDKVETKAGK